MRDFVKIVVINIGYRYKIIFINESSKLTLYLEPFAIYKRFTSKIWRNFDFDYQETSHRGPEVTSQGYLSSADILCCLKIISIFRCTVMRSIF